MQEFTECTSKFEEYTAKLDKLAEVKYGLVGESTAFIRMVADHVILKKISIAYECDLYGKGVIRHKRISPLKKKTALQFVPDDGSDSKILDEFKAPQRINVAAFLKESIEKLELSDLGIVGVDQ